MCKYALANKVSYELAEEIIRTLRRILRQVHPGRVQYGQSYEIVLLGSPASLT